MEATHNYWGANNRILIDNNISDINDNNGGNWVNYCPFWTSATMNSLSWDCTRTRVDFTSPVNASSHVGYNLTVNYSHLMVAIGDWYLDSVFLESFNIQNNSILLTGITIGWHALCAQVSGEGNQQGTYCLTFLMTPYFPIVNITSPATNTILPTTQTSQVVDYATSNVTSGYWLVNGLNIGPANLNISSVQITGLQYGNNTICIVGLGLSNLVDTDCIVIWRNYPPVIVTIVSPADGAIIYGQTVTLAYYTANVTSATWYVDDVLSSDVQLNQSSQNFTSLSWGNHEFCIYPEGLDGSHPSVCVNVTLIAPPLEVQITSPTDGSSVPSSQVSIGYYLNNATEGNWTLNGTPVMGVTIWSQQTVILNLQRGPNIICIEAFGLDFQSLTKCITIIGHELDSDGDGVPDYSDNCPNTPIGTVVTSDGCTDPSLNDADQDGIPDISDICPNTPMGEISDSSGCSPSQKDADNDGIVDDLDDCPNDFGNSNVDLFGCPDTDGDGYSDAGDSFPEDSSQWSDFDGDGWGDNTLGNNSDECPTITGVVDGELGRGCPPAPDEPSPTANNTDNGTGNQTAPECPLCGLSYSIPENMEVNQSANFSANASLTLGANYWGMYTISWDFGDGNTSTGNKVTHTYLQSPISGSNLVTLCVDFTSGPNECKTQNIAITILEDPVISDGSNDSGTQNIEAGAFSKLGIAALAMIVIILTLSFLIIIFKSRSSDQSESTDEGLESDLIVQDEDEPLENEAQYLAESIDESETTTSFDDSGYEWMENPVGSGSWYYRANETDEWTYWEQ